MLPGFNTDVEYEGRVLHVQSECYGEPTRVLTSIVFCSGEVLGVVEHQYLDPEEPEDALLRLLARRLTTQHNHLVKGLQAQGVRSCETAPPTVRRRRRLVPILAATALAGLLAIVGRRFLHEDLPEPPRPPDAEVVTVRSRGPTKPPPATAPVSTLVPDRSAAVLTPDSHPDVTPDPKPTVTHADPTLRASGAQAETRLPPPTLPPAEATITVPSPEIEEPAPESPSAPLPPPREAPESPASDSPQLAGIVPPRPEPGTTASIPPLRPEPEPARAEAAALSPVSVDPPPRAVQRELPSYTRRARKKKQQGIVALNLVIDENGLVSEVTLARGIEGSDLNQAALEAARHWRFSPALKNGRPVSTRQAIRLEFSIDSGMTSVRIGDLTD